jgi:hypothetical protein
VDRGLCANAGEPQRRGDARARLGRGLAFAESAQQLLDRRLAVGSRAGARGSRDALRDLEVPERNRLLGVVGHGGCLALASEGVRRASA